MQGVCLLLTAVVIVFSYFKTSTFCGGTSDTAAAPVPNAIVELFKHTSDTARNL
jgi:hypothetical protein